VQQEVETALAKEREQGRTMLFLIRLDDAVMVVNAVAFVSSEHAQHRRLHALERPRLIQ
jgi:hypothetical protein